jgi:hypothetical protein
MSKKEIIDQLFLIWIKLPPQEKIEIANKLIEDKGNIIFELETKKYPNSKLKPENIKKQKVESYSIVNGFLIEYKDTRFSHKSFIKCDEGVIFKMWADYQINNVKGGKQ